MVVWLLAACDGVRGDVAEGLVLNEVLAKNLSTNQDNADEFDDWLEIYNGGDQPVSRVGLHVSDDSSAPARWPIPEGDPIQPGEHLLLWCDGEPEQGDNHGPFKLGGKGETVVLSYIDVDAPLVLDQVDFGEQLDDVSWARIPDGSIEWAAATPTPGDANE